MPPVNLVPIMPVVIPVSIINLKIHQLICVQKIVGLVVRCVRMLVPVLNVMLGNLNTRKLITL